MNKSPDANEQEPKLTHEQQEELAAFEKFQQKLREMFDKGTQAIDAEQFKQVLEKVSKEMLEIGEHSIDTINKAAKTRR